MAALEVVGGSKGNSDSIEPTYSLFMVRYRNSKKELVPRKVVAKSLEEALAIAKGRFSSDITKLIDITDQEETITV